MAMVEKEGRLCKTNITTFFRATLLTHFLAETHKISPIIMSAVCDTVASVGCITYVSLA